MATVPHDDVYDPIGEAAMQPAGERTLVRALRRGDPEAFSALYALYRAPIYNFIARIVGNAEDARDVTQEVFLKAFRQLPDNGRDVALKPWLYKVASTTCFDHLRARKRRVETSPIGQHDLPATFDLSERVETNGLVEQTLARLSDRHRLALVLKDLHGLRHDEIGSILGISRGAAETLLHRARESFRRSFTQLSPPTEIQPTCPVARRAVITLVGRDVSPLTKRRLVDHARDCPECRKALQLGAVGVAGLGLFLPQLPLPHGLVMPPVAPPTAVTPPTAAVAPAAAAPLAASTAAGGLLAKIAAVAATKVAVIAAAGAVTIAGAGVASSRLNAGATGRSHTPVVAAADKHGDKPAAATGRSTRAAGKTARGQGKLDAPGQVAAGSRTKGKKETPPGKAVSGAAHEKQDSSKAAKAKNDKAAAPDHATAQPGTGTKPVLPAKSNGQTVTGQDKDQDQGKTDDKSKDGS